MANTFVTSDTHLGHAKILKYCPSRGRLWTGVREMNIGLINNWNNVVGKNDHVYHLGDFAFFGRGASYEIIERLNGVKFLMLGNHDNRPPRQLLRHFENLLPQPFAYTKEIVFSHAPLHPSCLGAKAWKLNVHGHIHERVIEQGGVPDPRYMNVSVEQTGMKPISIDKITERLGLLQPIKTDPDMEWPS